jgi:hypothetical protein
LYASLEHYAEHLWPIWEALPERLRGASWSTQAGQWWGEPQAGAGAASQHPGPLLVASHGDAVSVAARGRDLVYVEHGAGQTYEGDPAGVGAAGLAGSTDRAMRNVVLFVCPNETVAERWRSRYNVPAVVVGCPKMDRWHRNRLIVPGPRLVVAVTFHWDSSLVPETMTAWPEYDPVLPELAAWCDAHDVQLVGHGHPRIWPRIERRWDALGVPAVRRLADVFDRASVLVADNTSAMYEFASLGRPVIALNAICYRRHIEHGLRFWSHVPGIEVDEPAELVGEWGAVATTVAALRQDVLLGDERRQAAVDAAYAHTDGHAAERAADAIVRMLEP